MILLGIALGGRMKLANPVAITPWVMLSFFAVSGSWAK
jgi:hypothetical protein